MKIITLWQPWASFVALNLKQFETRSWPTSYRGPLLIHAAKRHIDAEGQFVVRKVHSLTEGRSPHIRRDFPLGAVIAIADLTQCPQMTELPVVNPPWLQISLRQNFAPLELTVGDWREGRYAWKLESVRALDPIPWKGGQGLRDAPEELQQMVNQQLQEVA